MGRAWLRGRGRDPEAHDDDRWVSREEMRVMDDVCTRFMTKVFSTRTCA